VIAALFALAALWFGLSAEGVPTALGWRLLAPRRGGAPCTRSV